MQSFVFDFRNSTSFFKQGWNREFELDNLENESFSLILYNDMCENNLSECIDNQGILQYSDDDVIIAPCALKVVEHDSDNFDIVLNDEVSFIFDSEFSMKGIFLVTGTDYVMGYSINTYSVNVLNQMIFEEGLIFWSVRDGVVNG